MIISVTVCICIIINKKSIFLAQIYLLVFFFGFRNCLGSFFSGADLFACSSLVLIVKNGEKCVYISVLILYSSARLMDLNFYFYDAFFNYKKMVKKGIWQ